MWGENLNDSLGMASGSGPATSLYPVWSGGNDVIHSISGIHPNNPTAIDQQATTMAARSGTSITTLSNAGARSFIVANLPAFGDKPSFIITPNQAFASAIVDACNPKLAGLESRHDDINIDARADKPFGDAGSSRAARGADARGVWSCCLFGSEALPFGIVRARR